jgi:hypothetical protein
MIEEPKTATKIARLIKERAYIQLGPWPVDLQLVIFSTTFGWRCGLSPVTQTFGDAQYRDAVLETLGSFSRPLVWSGKGLPIPTRKTRRCKQAGWRNSRVSRGRSATQPEYGQPRALGNFAAPKRARRSPAAPCPHPPGARGRYGGSRSPWPGSRRSPLPCPRRYPLAAGDRAGCHQPWLGSGRP